MGSINRKQVAWMTAIGAVLGLALAAAGGYYAASLLYRMTAIDPAVLGTSTAVLTVVALLAGLIPAVRASRVDPMKALRYE